MRIFVSERLHVTRGYGLTINHHEIGRCPRPDLADVLMAKSSEFLADLCHI